MRDSRAPTARIVSDQQRTGPTRAATAASDAVARPGRQLDAPLVLDRYRLHRRLGAGAFGTVWLARDERLERDVAVKVLARERIVGGRFEREARAAARLSHPGIVTLYEAAVDDEGAYLVSELVRGRTLDTLLGAGELSDRDIVAIAIALCDALDHAHSQGVVHRDVKPSNVLVPEPSARRGGPVQFAKLTDFGVARLVDSDSLTVTGDVLGTEAYMAPEQAEGLEAGAPADLYSLALMVYEALTGLNPVRSGAAARRARRLGAHLPPLRRQRRDLPAELGRAIDCALRPRPRERGSIAELRRALESAGPRVGDEPGVVAGPWMREPVAAEQAELEAFARREPAARRHALGRLDRGPDPAGLGWPARGLAAVTAAGFAAWLAATVLAPAPVPPAAVALLGAGAVLVAPRLGWVALAVALAGTATVGHHPGGALVIAIAMLLPVILLPGRPSAWPLSAAAPALGLIALAGAWPALAGRALGTFQRAALGAIGWVWLLLASAIDGRVLYLPRVSGTPRPRIWIDSLSQATGHLLTAFVSAGVLAPSLVWALAAVVTPWLVRGRAPVLDIVRVVIWAAVVVSATSAAVIAVHGSDAVRAAPSAVVGAVAGSLVALVPLGAARWRGAWRSPSLGARLP